MSIDFEERLRADMGQVQVRPRPGLARDAHRRYQKSRRRNALAVAATGAAAAVAGTAAGLALTAGSPGTAPIETTAYVVNRVSDALAATDAIGYSTAQFSGPGAPRGDIGQTNDTWQFGERGRWLTVTAAGQPSVDLSWRPADRSFVFTRVDYQDRTWTRGTPQPGQVPPPTEGNNLCSGGSLDLFGNDSESAADWRNIIETGLKCGAFTVAGRQWVDGVDAIKLASHTTGPGSTIWVSPGSYLPVRLVTHLREVEVGRGPNTAPFNITLTIDFRWLPPTTANLAKLTAPIPDGFRKVAYT
jgi:hypothetical protein